MAGALRVQRRSALWTPVPLWLCCPQAVGALLCRQVLPRREHGVCCLQAITAAPDIAKQYSQQIVETEHLLKALREQPNGLARKIVAKAEGNPTALLDATEAFIRRQPRVSGDSSQVCCQPGLLIPFCRRRCWLLSWICVCCAAAFLPVQCALSI